MFHVQLSKRAQGDANTRIVQNCHGHDFRRARIRGDLTAVSQLPMLMVDLTSIRMHSSFSLMSHDPLLGPGMHRRKMWLSSSVLVYALAHERPHEPFLYAAPMSPMRHDGSHSDVTAKGNGAGDLLNRNASRRGLMLAADNVHRQSA